MGGLSCQNFAHLLNVVGRGTISKFGGSQIKGTPKSRCEVAMARVAEIMAYLG